MAFTASSSLSWRRPVMKTYAPSSTNSLAVASAMPEVAAVITANFPSSLPIVSPVISLGLAKAAAGKDLFPCKPTGVVGGKEDRHRGDVAGLSYATERGLGDERLLKVGADE